MGMIDVSSKEVVSREAEAEGTILLQAGTLKRIAEREIRKGDPFSFAEAAGMAAIKQTHLLIPHCHPIPVEGVEFRFDPIPGGIRVRCRVRALARTGVEMEALLGVTLALNTLWDMVKYLEKDAGGQYPHTRISEIRILEKQKGAVSGRKTPSDHPHVKQAPSRANFAILSVSTSRTQEQDSAGDLIETLVRAHGHHVSGRSLVKDEVNAIRDALHGLLDTEALLVVLTGGTGITPTDVTVEALEPLFQKRLPGFSALFTRLSYEEIGPAAILSRAVGGIISGKAVFCLPGNPNACRLAMERILLPEASHLAGHLTPH